MATKHGWQPLTSHVYKMPLFSWTHSHLSNINSSQHEMAPSNYKQKLQTISSTEFKRQEFGFTLPQALAVNMYDDLSGLYSCKQQISKLYKVGIM